MKILVTGADGLVGSGIRSISEKYQQHEFVFVGRRHCELTNRQAVDKLIYESSADAIIHTAARVGGIGRNLNSPAQQFTENILMNTNVIDAACFFGVKKLIAFSSVCVFPKDAPILREDNMHDGPPFPAHWSYAMSKRMVDVQLDAYKKQYGFQGCSVIPTNIYGPNDNYDLEDGHVVPSLIHKAYLAKKEDRPLEVWGDGSALREFIYSEDLARICVGLLEKDELPQRLITPGQEKSIKEVVEEICFNTMHYDVVWDTSKPSGQKRRETDRVIFDSVFPDFEYVDFDDGIARSVEWFAKNYPNCRGVV